MTDGLVLKTIKELLGEHFYIPYYQRGYRWTPQQVKDLLDDIWAFATKPKERNPEFYCLQPIVVKRKSWQEGQCQLDGWEVVDGQQRLTTLYIIVSYLAKEFLKVESLKDDYGKEIFSLKYETRQKSGEFLKNITDDKSNIDFYHISLAYKTIEDWFIIGNNIKDRNDKNKFLGTLLGKEDDERSVQIIWYNVEAKEETSEKEIKKSIELFTRLNIGKIPLTNAELIKALFLSSSSFKGENPEKANQMKMEISQLWDDMEQKLGDEDGRFWSFVTNAKRENYSTKIELLFDVISKKRDTEIDSLYTFLYFLRESKISSKSLWDLWILIEKYYLTLCEWYKEKNLYHKIGYLIADGKSISYLIGLSIKEKKNCFEAIVDKEISNSVDFDIEELSYEKDYNKIEKVLLLFNVESIRANKSITEFYPFKSHKKTLWSLEHIHAQNSESLDQTKKESWFKWLNYHNELIEELIADEKDTKNVGELKKMLAEINLFNNEKLTWDKFISLSRNITDWFTEKTDDTLFDRHSISNLALLGQPDNSALNNSVFEVKRREIINMDKNGNYIPICTRRVFFKYYNDKPSTQQYYFWSKEDRKNYQEEIKKVLKNYLPQKNVNLN